MLDRRNESLQRQLFCVAQKFKGVRREKAASVRQARSSIFCPEIMNAFASARAPTQLAERFMRYSRKWHPWLTPSTQKIGGTTAGWRQPLIGRYMAGLGSGHRPTALDDRSSARRRNQTRAFSLMPRCNLIWEPQKTKTVFYRFPLSSRGTRSTNTRGRR